MVINRFILNINTILDPEELNSGRSIQSDSEPASLPFFRWEDSGENLSGMMYNESQVEFFKEGDFISFTKTLI